MFKYEIFGMNVLSEIELGCYQARFDTVDVTIKRCGFHSDKNAVSGLARISKDSYWFYIKGVGSFEIKDGCEILLSPEVDASLRTVEMYVLGTCFGVLMIQNGDFPLHGSFVMYKNAGIGIIGDSGAGKTSLASGFSLNEGKIVTDDVMRITYELDNPYVNASYPSQKIWGNTASKLSINVDKSKPILNRMNKYYRDEKEAFFKDKVRLEYPFEIIEADVNKVEVVEVFAADGLELLIRNTYRSYVLYHMKKLKDHLMYMMRLNSYVRTFVIKRPIGQFTVNEQIEAIEFILGEQNEQIS